MHYDKAKLSNYLLQSIFESKNDRDNKSIYKTSKGKNILWLNIKKVDYLSKSVFEKTTNFLSRQNQKPKPVYTMVKYSKEESDKLPIYDVFKFLKEQQNSQQISASTSSPKIEDRFLYEDKEFILLDVFDETTKEAKLYLEKLNKDVNLPPSVPTTLGGGKPSLKKTKGKMKKAKTSLKKKTSFFK